MFDSILPKFLTAWLVIIILPLTAPFSTRGLVGAHGPHAPLARPASAVRNDAAFPSVPSIVTGGRVRLERLPALPLVHTNASTSSAHLMSRCVSAAFIAEQVTLATILRL